MLVDRDSIDARTAAADASSLAVKTANLAPSRRVTVQLTGIPVAHARTIPLADEPCQYTKSSWRRYAVGMTKGGPRT
jgi:hypothetical protein